MVRATKAAAAIGMATVLPSVIQPLAPVNIPCVAAPRTDEPPATAAAVEPERIGESISLSVAFGNVNIGDKTASLGITIDREDFSISQADEYLCGHRVGATIIGKPPGNNADQGNLPILADDVTLTSNFDIKSFGTTRKAIKCTLAVNLADISVTTLSKFAKRNGKFVINNITDLPRNAAKAPKAAAQEEEDDEFDAPE